MSLTALQAAAVIAGQTTFAKLSVTFGLRLWQTFASHDKTEMAKLESTSLMQRLKAAQLNEAEYAPLFVALLVLVHVQDGGETARPHLAGTLAAVSQVGYYWLRILTGYPSLPTAGVATIRYGALGLLCWQVYQLAF